VKRKTCNYRFAAVVEAIVELLNAGNGPAGAPLISRTNGEHNGLDLWLEVCGMCSSDDPPHAIVSR